ncbi:helix-turn-helix transcriptional regulator [Glycomyces paridis]|uniref:YafY family transcriptional regulator n=1 Tax=Glycomyces paridis TaxID=2126555 RepID=A0A4S8PFA1_9ACTN|nr:YafY family protein [Glycomyces paridis]THV29098.1 YafY family transcriptional regulator [Glycomyces paridis]
MLETSARLLRLLSHLQARPEWSAPELAERLEVSTRTVRRDVQRLRELGYPVASSLGAAGGYRLAAGAKLPPLLLDDEEAVAVAVALRTARDGSVAGIRESAGRALVKLDRVLPPRLRGPVRALESATVVPEDDDSPVEGRVLALLATACRDRMLVRFDYTGHGGDASFRRVEPVSLVARGRRWYLVAFDLDRDDWRTFRVDRMAPRERVGPGFAGREVPGGDAVAYLTRGFLAAWPHRVRVRLAAPAELIASAISPADGVVEPLGDADCVLTLGGSDPLSMAAFLCMFGVDFELLEAGPVADALTALARRCAAAVPPVAPSRP